MQNPDEKVRRRMIASYIDSLAYSESEESDEEISIQNVNYSQVFGTARWDETVEAMRPSGTTI